jgi:hypothetical protein
MANSHYERWIVKAPVGLIFIAGGIFFMYYSLTQLAKDRWVFYAAISAATVTIGTFMLASAFINKMKSDLIKKQKAKNLPEKKEE